VCASIELAACEPLWNESTSALISDFLSVGGRARIAAVDRAKLEEGWLGVPLTREAVDRFTALGIDPCGEYGEYHTVVEWAPGFTRSLRLRGLGSYDFSGYAASDFCLDES